MPNRGTVVAMRTVHARRSGAAPLGRAFVRALAVVALMTGVIAMHALGVGHCPMADAPVAMPAMQAAAGKPEATQITTTSVVLAGVAALAGVADHPHGTAAMCLAVLPLLVLLVARSMGWRVRRVVGRVRSQDAPGVFRGDRAPPAYLCPSLLKLCILRT